MNTSTMISRHESATENFYQTGVENYGEFHGGYLNFGLWTDGIEDFTKAAENLIQTLGERLELGSGARLLDVACGMGSQDIHLHRHFGPIEIDAVDLTEVHLAHGRRRAAAAGCSSSVRFHHASATRLPFDDSSFSHALAVEGIAHFDTRQDFFTESMRVLEPGGRLAIADFIAGRKIESFIERMVMRSICKAWHIPLANADTIDVYRSKLECEGFEDIEIEVVTDDVIPGYFREQCSAECKRELARIRGPIAGRLGHIIDHIAYQAYKYDFVDYVLVSARKPR